VAVRVEDGTYRAVDPTLMAALGQMLGWEQPPPPLARFQQPELRNSPGDVVGFLRADVPLTRA
jgi:hypothetical protein